ncbi:hypothetical protein JHK82_018013 [Glycine max]|nr:hypothetical protein JHK82_018013 [Glycine max]
MVSVTLHAAQSVKASTVMASVSCFVLIVRAPSAMVSVRHASIASTPSLSVSVSTSHALSLLHRALNGATAPNAMCPINNLLFCDDTKLSPPP